jgi:hypothetical protein
VLASLVIAATDAETAARRVRWTITGLIAVAVVMVAVTVWFWIATRPHPPALERLHGLHPRRRRDAAQVAAEQQRVAQRRRDDPLA